MRALATYLLFAVGLTVCLGVGPVALALSAPATGNGSVLVIVPPWSGGAASVVQAAGGRVVGPTEASLSVLATGTSVGLLHDAGAWLVLDAAALEAICSTEEQG